ncbi:MAG TPA: UDP-glucose/GDP-mannose dehydrogenase family protein, partial [Acetobacteraceae bacterium]|nr:UDP-glucose/GDP-mannose dehydrogenase family protein [Acetobacteraceae bacterium]
EQARPHLPDGLRYATDAMDALAGADVLVLVTEWNEFRALAPDRLAAAMTGRVIMDMRNVFDPIAMRAAGFDYHGIGRGGPMTALATETPGSIRPARAARRPRMTPSPARTRRKSRPASESAPQAESKNSRLWVFTSSRNMAAESTTGRDAAPHSALSL